MNEVGVCCESHVNVAQISELNKPFSENKQINRKTENKQINRKTETENKILMPQTQNQTYYSIKEMYEFLQVGNKYASLFDIKIYFFPFLVHYKFLVSFS